jgi:CelD/BcsL family acetyltransferase involved in cellulose biosynthesis
MLRQANPQAVAAPRTHTVVSAENGAAPLHVEVRSLDDELGPIGHEWQALASRPGQGSLFASPLWVMNYWKYRGAYRQGASLIIARTPQGRIAGLVPLVRVRSMLGRLFPTYSAVHSRGEYPSDCVADEKQAPAFVSALCDHFQSQKRPWYQITLAFVPDHSPILTALLKEWECRGWSYVLRPAAPVPFVATDRPGNLLERIDGNERRELSRRLRKLQHLGRLHFETHQSSENLAQHFEEFLAVEGAGWKGQRHTAIRCQPDARRFWWQLACAAARLGVLRLDLLRLDARVISGQLGIIWAGRYHCLKLGYHPEFRSHAPGCLMTQHVIQACIDDPNIAVYDFAGPAGPYMSRWTSSFYKTWHLSLGTPTLLGGGIFKAYAFGRELAQRLRGTFR